MGFKEEDIQALYGVRLEASLLPPTSPISEIINVTSEADTAPGEAPGQCPVV